MYVRLKMFKVKESANRSNTCYGHGGLVVGRGPQDREVQGLIPARTIGFSGHGTNPTCASPHPGVKWVPVRVWVNESGCSKRQSVNDEHTYDLISGEVKSIWTNVDLKRGLYKCGILYYIIYDIRISKTKILNRLQLEDEIKNASERENASTTS